MAKAADRPFGKTVQISSISTTIRSKQKLKDLSVKVESGGVRIEKQKFKEKLVSKIEFKPPRSIGNESTLRVKLCQSQLFREVVLSEMEFTVQSAQAILGHQIEVIGKQRIFLRVFPLN
ncbi:hypothetical protein B0H16DRAFT_1462620 [Mycena metata]|uniref:Uncharacterized protein n=1 Tax=Mycena metata TaxID=1033252 RepID=A0AAD7IPJ7_9AGAR|nr:hypothetical protein B0H16DRAFT_1462620 [Mycena metata]